MGKESFQGHSQETEPITTKVQIPKLNGYLKVELGPDVVKAQIGDITFRPLNSSYWELSAPTQGALDEFLLPFQGEDADFNPHREVYRGALPKYYRD